jgi:PAS domain S-box-containing protein
MMNAEVLARDLSGWEALSAVDQSLLEAIPVALAVCTPDGAVLRANGRAVALFRKAGTQAVKLLAADGAPVAAKTFPAGSTLTLEGADGTRTTGIADVEHVRDAHGRIQGFIACFHDHAADGGLSEHRLRSILDALPVAIYMTDAEGSLSYFNRAAADLAGRDPQIGKDKWCVADRLLHADGRPMAPDECPMAVTLREQRPVRGVEMIAERPDGDRVPLVPFPTPLYDSGGAFTGAVNVLLNVADLKRAQATVAKRAHDQETLYRFTDQLYRAENAAGAYEAALDAIQGGLRCSRASILLFDNKGVMRFVASRGLSAEYCKAVEGHSPWKPGDRDSQPICIADIDATDEPESLKATIRSEGIRALAFIPLTENGVTIGKFMAYHDAPHTFTADELGLGVTIARQLGFSVGRTRAQDARRTAEAQLRSSEEYWRSVFDRVGTGLVAMDRSYVISTANAAFAAICGHSIDDLIGRSCLALTHPDDMSKNDVALEELTRTGNPVAFEKRYVTKRGRHVWVRFTLSNGEHGELLGVVEDIDARKRADERVRQSANQVALVMNAAPVPIAYVDKNLHYRLVNKAYARRFDLTPDECVGRHTTEIAGGDAMGPFKQYIDAALAGESVEFEVEAQYARGMRVMHGHYEPEFDAAGEVVGFVAVVADITERKRDEDALRASEQRLRESEERFRLIAESAPVMLWKGDHTGKCTYLNKALRDFWGVSFEQMATFDWTSTIHPEDRAALFDGFGRAMETHTPFAVEARYRRADGEYRMLGTQARPRFGPLGEFVGMIGINVDVTERKRAEEQRTLLINELNHRVKNTLATVQSLASQTLRNTERSADARPMFEARLLALSRAHDVLTRQSWQGASLREVVDRALEPFRTGNDRIRVEGVDVRLSPKQALALSMALHELATNAAKYGALSNDGGRIEVAWRVALDGGAELQLTWTESGGPPVVPPARTGFGSRLIQRSLALDLGGATSIEYRPQGLVCVIKTPVETATFDPLLWP